MVYCLGICREKYLFCSKVCGCKLYLVENVFFFSLGCVEVFFVEEYIGGCSIFYC